MTNGAVSADIEARSASWHFEALEEDVVIPYATTGGDVDKLLYGGVGEKDVMGIAARLADQGVTGLAVASIVYPETKLTLEVVEASIIEGSKALVHDITGNGDPIARGIGNSGGGGQLMLAMYHAPELFEDAVAIAPGPLNPEALGANFKAQARTLLDRFEEADLKEILANNAAVGPMELMREIRAGLAYAESQDRSRIFAAVAGKLRIYVGERDVVAPPIDYADGIIEEDITLIPGMNHPTLLNEQGCEYVAGIISMTDPTPEVQATAL